MSVVVSELDVKDALPKCPICTDCFHDISRIPRRMPCCGRWICEDCLKIFNPKCFNLCPLCRRQRQPFDSKQYLPIEVLIFRFVEVLKTQSRDLSFCATCPKRNSAVGCCVNCNIYLCQTCLDVHIQDLLSRRHRTIIFEESPSIESASTDGTVTEITSQNTSKLNKKLHCIAQRHNTLAEIESNVEKSTKIAMSQINRCFDEFVEKLKQRRAILIAHVESKAEIERNSIAQTRESQKNLQLQLQTALTRQRPSTMETLLKDKTENVGYNRLGFSFIPANIQQLKDRIKQSGQVRTVQFRPTERPDGVRETATYNAIQIRDDCPQAAAVIPEEHGGFVCPHLEFDPSTANRDVTVSKSVIINTKPEPPEADTWCRMQEGKLTLISSPLVIEPGQRVMYQVKFRYVIKQMIQQNTAIIESSLTSYPVDSSYVQNNGLSIQVTTCSNHKQQLCLFVVYNCKPLRDIPLSSNQVGKSRDLHLGFLLDGNTNVIHVVDVKDVKLLLSLTDVVFDKPLWVMMGVEVPELSDSRIELVSGNSINLSQELSDLLHILSHHLF